MAKFIMSIGDESFKHLESEAKSRDVSVQQLLRAVIVPDWIRQNMNGHAPTVSIPVRPAIYGVEARRNDGNGVLLSPVNRLRQ